MGNARLVLVRRCHPDAPCGVVWVRLDVLDFDATGVSASASDMDDKQRGKASMAGRSCDSIKQWLILLCFQDGLVWRTLALHRLVAGSGVSVDEVTC